MAKRNDHTAMILERGVEEVIERDHLASALASEKRLRVKFGIDPTSPDIHLGHTVVLRKLRQFQDAGHTAVLIIGDFTGQIGDPSGRSEARKPLTKKEVRKNEATYLEQAGKVLDLKRAEVRHNSEWHEQKGLAGLLELARAVTVQQVLKRDDFERRLKAKSEISLLETLYPLLQGYDSVAVRADVELGGTDQRFNLLMGRRVQRHYGLPEQDVLTMPLLEGTDGARKMSKSYGNYVGLTDTPSDMFGKLMAIPDKLIERYRTLLTDEEPPKGAGPYEAKLRLAETIVEMYHPSGSGREAHTSFRKVFSEGQTPDEAPTLQLTGKQIPVVDLLLMCGVPSKSEARRLAEGGAVRVNGLSKKDPAEVLTLRGGEVVKIGKRRFFRIS